MGELSRREFVQAGAIGLTAIGIGALGKGASGEEKTTSMKPKGPGIKKWPEDPTPPTRVSQGPNYVLIAGPSEDEDENRVYCEVSYTVSGAPGITVLDSGDIGYPFDGSIFLVPMVSGKTYTFTARAIYDDDTEISMSMAPITWP